MDTNTPPMTIDVTGLPPEVVLHLQQLIQSLRVTTGTVPAPQRPSLRGAYEHLRNGSMSEEDFRAYRREIWGTPSVSATPLPEAS